MTPNIINRYVSKKDTARLNFPYANLTPRPTGSVGYCRASPATSSPRRKPRGGLVLTLQRASPHGGRASILKRVSKSDMDGAASFPRSHQTDSAWRRCDHWPIVLRPCSPPPETRAVANRAYGNGNQVPRQGVRKSQAPQLDSRVACTPSTGLRHWTQTSQK